MSVKKPEKKIFSKTVGDVYPIHMFPTFADPKNDFIFKRIFGSDSHKDLLIELLNALLELDDEHKIVAVNFLPPEQQIPVKEMKSTIVDVRCQDVNGVHYVVEMQTLTVSQMEKRVVYNVCKDYVLQLKRAEQYPELNDVIAITICGFRMWDD